MGKGSILCSNQTRLVMACLAMLLVMAPLAAHGQIGQAWVRVKDDAGFPERLYHASVVFDGKIWLFGGASETLAFKNDVWSSTDGITWEQETAAAAWSERAGHAAVVYNGRIWLLGGQDALGNGLNDVWWSDDGVNWTEATDAGAWAGRYFHRSVVYNGRIWLLAGYDGTNSRNDVWWSMDGANWTQATAGAAWTGRASASAVVFNNRIYVLGGFDFGASQFFNDVWWTTDGGTWNQAALAAAWPARDLHASVNFLNRIWVLGGFYDPLAVRDVWYSSDGTDWTRGIDAAEWPRRLGSTSVVFDAKLFVMGGANGDVGTLDDVWYTTADGSFRGRVTMESGGAPIECAAVLVKSEATGYRRVAMSDANGDWRLDDVTPGNYEITVYAPGFGEETMTRGLAQGVYEYVNFTLAEVNANGGIRGTVTDMETSEAVPGIRVRAFIGGEEVGLTYTCGEGRYELPALVSKGGTEVMLTFDDDIDNGFNDADSMATVDPTQVATADVQIMKAIAAPGALAGIVESEGAASGIANATVNVDGLGNVTQTTDNDGAYLISALPEGRYTVRASAPGFAGKTQLVNVAGAQIQSLDFVLETDSPRDIDNSGGIDAVDVQLVINAVLGLATGFDVDVNRDGEQNAVDVQLVINGALGLKQAG